MRLTLKGMGLGGTSENPFHGHSRGTVLLQARGPKRWPNGWPLHWGHRARTAMQIRQARVEDARAVMGLVARVVPIMRASGNLQWDDEYPNAAVFEHDIHLEQLWVIEIEGQIAGLASITTDQEPEYEQVGWDITETAIVVHRLAVDPAFRGRGIAAALMLQAEVVAGERSIPVLRADTNISNEATQRPVFKLGYELAGEIGLSYRPGIRNRCYEKRLTL